MALLSALGAPTSLILFTSAVAIPATVGRVAPARSHEVRMVGATNPRFEPAEVEVTAGDTVVFVLVSGAPHNVAFDSTALAPAATRRLREAVHDSIMPLAGPLLLKEGDRYAVSFADVPSGRYPFYCMPHAALHMRGTVIVR